MQNLGLPLCQSTAGVILCPSTVPSSCFIRIRDLDDPNRVYWEPSGAAPAGTAPGPSTGPVPPAPPPMGEAPRGEGTTPKYPPQKPKEEEESGWIPREEWERSGWQEWRSWSGWQEPSGPRGPSPAGEPSPPSPPPGDFVGPPPGDFTEPPPGQFAGPLPKEEEDNPLSPATTCRLKYVRIATSAS